VVNHAQSKRPQGNQRKTLETLDPLHLLSSFNLLNAALPTSLELTDEILEQNGIDPSYPLQADPRDLVDQRLMAEEIQEQIGTLTEIEGKVLHARYWKGLTLRDAGSLCDVSPERIRQIEAKAIQKLRHPLRSNKLLCMLHNLTGDELRDKRQKEEERAEAEAEVRRKVWEAKDAIRQKEQAKRDAIKFRALLERKAVDEQRRKKMQDEFRIQHVKRIAKENDIRAEGQKAKRNRTIQDQANLDVITARGEAEEEASARRWDRYNNYLIHQLKLHGDGYCERDIPTPPNYITLDRDSAGNPYLKVEKEKYFTVPDTVYTYWLKYLIQMEKSDE